MYAVLIKSIHGEYYDEISEVDGLLSLPQLTFDLPK